MYSDMSIRTIASWESNMNSARARELGLADAGLAEEEERADRPVGVLEPGARAAQGVGDGDDRLVLADHPLVQALLHVDQLLDLALEHAGDGDAGPLRHDLGDLVRVDALREVDGRLHVAVLRARLRLGELLLELRDLAVAQLGGALVVELALGALELHARGVEPLAQLAVALGLLLLALPLGLHAGELLAQVGELALDLLPPLGRGLVALDGDQLDLELLDPPADLVDLGRHRRDLDRDARGGLVDEIDRLVGQEAVGDVAVRQRRRGDQSGVRDRDLVVRLVALLEPAEDGDRRLDARLADVDRLEAALERGVLLDVLAV